MISKVFSERAVELKRETAWLEGTRFESDCSTVKLSEIIIIINDEISSVFELWLLASDESGPATPMVEKGT